MGQGNPDDWLGNSHQGEATIRYQKNHFSGPISRKKLAQSPLVSSGVLNQYGPTDEITPSDLKQKIFRDIQRNGITKSMKRHMRQIQRQKIMNGWSGDYIDDIVDF
ncbi:MAG: hypothetical protein ACI9BD_000304 [Candidatus Marinamargulisbacteria bacterium]